MLTQRRMELLNILVGEYIGSASPVASQTMASKHSLGISSATIRNEMAELEEEGYISRPHPSAGAVPTDRGYRCYVESLSEAAELPRDYQYTIRYQFTSAERDIEGWTRLAATVLSQMVSNVALITYPKWPRSHLVRIDLVYVQEFLALLILVLQETKLRKQILALKEPLASEDLQRVANRLSSCYSGLSRSAILSRSLELSPFEQQVTDMIGKIMLHEDQTLFGEHRIEGLRHLLGQPEFSAGGKAREIVEVLEDKELPRAVLAEAPEWGRLKVIIGEENKVTFLHPFSMVVCQYGLPGGGLGSISAIGPTRMEYSRTMAGVKFVSSLMTELIAQVHG